MSKLDIANLTLHHIRQSVHSQYGKGFNNFIRYTYYSLFRKNTFVIFIRNCHDVAGSSENNPRLRVIRKDFKELYHFRHYHNLPREFYCDMTIGVKDFFMGLWDETPAYIHWVFPAGSKSRFLHLGKECAEINYMLTLPDFRGRRICSSVISYTIRQLEAEGVQRTFCVIHTHNIASIKALKRAGFKEFNRIKSIGQFNARMEVAAL